MIWHGIVTSEEDIVDRHTFHPSWLEYDNKSESVPTHSPNVLAAQNHELLVVSSCCPRSLLAVFIRECTGACQHVPPLRSCSALLASS